MIKGAVGRRYARAIFDLALGDGSLDQWTSDLKDIHRFLTEPAVARVLRNPEISYEQKQKVVAAGLSGVRPVSLNFVNLLVRKRRTDRIGEIVAEFERLYNEQQGLAAADVTTAIPLDQPTLDMVTQRLSDLVGKRVMVRSTVDPNIIGGVVARIGDKLIDGSVAGRLAALKERLLQG